MPYVSFPYGCGYLKGEPKGTHTKRESIAILTKAFIGYLSFKDMCIMYSIMLRSISHAQQIARFNFPNCINFKTGHSSSLLFKPDFFIDI